MWGTLLSPSPWRCLGNLVKVTSLQLTLPAFILAGVSTLGDDDEEEGNQVLAWDRAGVSREPGTPLCLSLAQEAGWASWFWVVAGAGVLWLRRRRLARYCLGKALSLAFLLPASQTFCL